jgi:hypothetical protein
MWQNISFGLLWASVALMFIVLMRILDRLRKLEAMEATVSRHDRIITDHSLNFWALLRYLKLRIRVHVSMVEVVSENPQIQMED